jgi:hypothetical protein
VLLSAAPDLRWWPKVRKREPIPATHLTITEIHFGELVTTGCGALSTTIAFKVSSEDGLLDGQCDREWHLVSAHMPIFAGAPRMFMANDDRESVLSAQ